ncbi:Inosine triphosphate pyrophosphatase, partial [Stegodyphus mimosarum]
MASTFLLINGALFKISNLKSCEQLHSSVTSFALFCKSSKMGESMFPSADAVSFVCGNSGKIREAESILKDSYIKIHYVKLDLPEYQGDSDFVSKSKCRSATSVVKGPVIVEDTSLCFNAFHGLPGPYIKWFYEKLGSEGLHRLLTGWEDKSASAVCTLAFTEGPDKEVFLFSGEVKGTIVA